MHRVEELAEANSDQSFTYETDDRGVVWIKDPKNVRPKFVSLVPFLEVLSEALGSGVSTIPVISMYEQLVSRFSSEHEVLFRTDLNLTKEISGSRVSEAIERVRSRSIAITPGFDGEYGKVKIWNDEDIKKEKKDQIGFSF